MTTTPAPAPSPAQRPIAGTASLQGPLPSDPNARLLLFAFRRMGAHGLHDAAASATLMQAFGGGFRRPLVLMRAMMADLAHAATCPITIAPCCCARMTGSETTVLTILARAETAPDSARLLLGDLIGVRRPDGVLASITLLAQAFADAGRPISF